MSKETFTAKQLEEALEGLRTVDGRFPEYPLLTKLDEYSEGLWNDSMFPLTFRKIGNAEKVTVRTEEYFYGEEGGDHNMYIILKVGYEGNTRFFMKTGEYNSWDDSEWDGPFLEVVPKEVLKTEWVGKS